MKLNENGKVEIRNYIEKEINNVPAGERIKIDNDMLDDLIFFKGKDKQGKDIKIPIWTGWFLKKIDLSEISFENVYLGDPGELSSILNEDTYEKFQEFICRYNKYNKRTEEIMNDFSGTNINIDFKKLYDQENIVSCNFSHVDLNKQDLSKVKNLSYCDFSYTNITLGLDKMSNRVIQICDFTGIDLSKENINITSFDNSWWVLLLSLNNFHNTGLKINVPFSLKAKDSKNLIDEYERDPNNTSLARKVLSEGIINEKLSGCYLNGKRISTKEERNQKKREISQSYSDYILELKKSIEITIIQSKTIH